jgi:hypothetical protein
MADYIPQSQREYAIIHTKFVPPPPPDHKGPEPTTSRPTRPDITTLTGTALVQIQTWLQSAQTAADDAAVTEAAAITKRDALKAFFAADRAWKTTQYAYFHATWHGTYVDALMDAHNSEILPPSQTGDGITTNPPPSPVRRNEV